MSSINAQNHVVDESSVYVSLRLTHFKVIDHLCVIECYHCQGYNHLDRDCPD